MTNIIKRISRRINGKTKAAVKEFPLGAVRRPEVGTQVVVIQDEGPPGLENIRGWLGVSGYVVFDTIADQIGGVAVEMLVEDTPFPEELKAHAEQPTVSFIWMPQSVQST